MTITFSDGILHEVTESLAEDHDLWAKHFLAAFEKMIQNGYDEVLEIKHKKKKKNTQTSAKPKTSPYCL